MNASLTNQMILLFGLIIIGYIANKAGALDETANSRFSGFLLKVALPATIINSAIGRESAQKKEILFTLLIAAGVFLLIPFLSWILARIFHWKATWQLMLNYSNLGFMGFPVIAGLYGDDAVFYAALFMMVFNVHIFTAGVMLLQKENGAVSSAQGKNAQGKKGENRVKGVLHSLCNPGIISSFLALAIVILGIPVPLAVENIVSSLGAVTTPLALIVIGSQLAQVNLLACISRRELYLMSLFKLAIYPAVIYFVFTALAGPGLVTKIAAILTGLPVAGNVTMLCSEYDGDVSLAAAGTCVSTVLSIITIPIMAGLIG